MPDRNRIALGSFNDNRSFFYSTHCEYSHLWLIDNRCSHQAAESAYVRQGKRSALRFFGFELAVPRIFCKSVDLLRKADKIKLIGIFNNRYNQVT